MVHFQNVFKSYDDDKSFTTVKDVTFKVEEGEFVFLIGPSGSGKTTLIKMMIRDELPSEGRIYFNDLDITRISRNKVYQLRREIGVIFQDFKLVPEKTAFENVAFAMEAAGKSNREIQETVPYVLDIVGLSKRIKAFPAQLSGGEQQRVAIARAIANNPKILIADEPTGNLDPASSWDIVQILTKINNWGTTVIMSTHGTDIVNSLNKRVIQMDRGIIIRDDNHGQYEMSSKYEKKVVESEEQDQDETPKATEPKKKKSTYSVKLEKDQPEAVIEEPKKQGFRWFGFFRSSPTAEALENKGEVGEEVEVEGVGVGVGVGVGQEMEKAKVKTSKKEKNKKNSPAAEALEKGEKGEEEEEVGVEVEVEEGKPELHIDLATKLKDVTVANIEESEEDDEKILEKFEGIKIEKLDLPKKVKKDLKRAGYKTAADIVEEGIENLSQKLIIETDEVVLVAKALEKISPM